MHLHRLRLTGPRRTYGVDFDKQESNLAVIAGPIHTGKTTILELVDYLLGDDEHPDHPELAATVRSAELEFSLDEQRWTVERPLFAVEQLAWLRQGSLDDEPALVQRKIIEPSADDDSLSSWLLNAVGLDGSRLRVTEDNPNTSVQALSFRDVMWLTYLPSRRLDNEALLHEGHDQKYFKLRQVIELLFDVHDDRLAQLLERQKLLVAERREAEREVAALETFLREEDVPDPTAARGRLEVVLRDRQQAEAGLAELTKRAAATTGYADELRTRYAKARQWTARAGAQARDREALLERLMPLRAQYAEDERKLVFQLEAERLFDPLQVRRCPGCLQDLDEEVTIEAGHCSLCQRELKPAEESVFEFKREQRALRQRIRDLDDYTGRVEDQIRQRRDELTRLEADETNLARELDDQTRTDLSPFIAQREVLVRQRTELSAEQNDLERAIRWHDALARRRAQVAQIAERLVEVRQALETLKSNQPDRRAVVAELSDRFAALLKAWGFPKLEDPVGPYLDEKFVPIVRGRPYRNIGSDGAKTLIAVAWMLAIFEMAVEHGAPHPGFVMIDGPQKNLAPRRGESPDEYMDPAIVERMYEHLQGWSGAHPTAQIILVDHEAPARATAHEIVRYTRRGDVPPYGLIDDQVERGPVPAE